MLAQALARMGIDRAFVVHGADGLDEISTTGPTTVFQVEENSVQKGRWQPADFGLPEAKLEDLQGGDNETNAAIIRSILEGEIGPKRDLVVANAAAALFVARRAIELKSAVAMAADSIDSGAARRKLEKLIEFTARLRHEVAS
jgi:anthranilate phosphoribosyltransferase